MVGVTLGWMTVVPRPDRSDDQAPGRARPSSDEPVTVLHSRRVEPGREADFEKAGSGRARILAIDVVRGLAVVGMLLVNNAGIPAAMPQALRHASWQGLTLADQVFPLFLFTVGASMPFSRRAQRPGAVLRRVVVLFLLGSLLVSAKQHRLAPSTGVLQQIAGAYLVAWALLRLPRRAQLPAAALLLAGLWAAFTFVSAPGVRPGSWAPGSNLADFVDRLLLGHFSEHGVLVMVASSVSVLAGVAAGRLLRGPPAGTTRRLLALGAGMLALGLLVAVVVPIGKPLWTPSFVLVTAGISALLTAAVHRLVDRGPGRSWARPLVTLGSNALALYAASVLLFAFLLKPWQAALVRPLAAAGGGTFAALAYAAGTVLVTWALAEWLYWRRVFVRV
jgi:predicted acyltransferase